MTAKRVQVHRSAAVGAARERAEFPGSAATLAGKRVCLVAARLNHRSSIRPPPESDARQPSPCLPQLLNLSQWAAAVEIS